MKFTISELDRIIVVGRMIEADLPPASPPEFYSLLIINFDDADDVVQFSTDSGYYLGISGDQFRRGISPVDIYNEALPKAEGD